MANFIDYFEDIEGNEEQLINILRAEADTIFTKYSAIRRSVFAKHPLDVKMLLQSRPNVFWDFWDYCEQKQETNREDSEVVKILREKGAHVMKGFFSQDEVESLKNMWDHSFQQFPDLSDLPFGKKRFRKEKRKEVDFVHGGPHDGRKRILYARPFNEYSRVFSGFPEENRKLLLNNPFFTQTVLDYFHLDMKGISPFRIMMEHLTPTRFNRNDKGWHIDNLTDQFKVMIILEDMTEKDGPFSFIPYSHRVKPHQKTRYHKMYAMLGIDTHSQNHFEEDFTDPEAAQTVVGKAGDIVLFDCRTHHSGNFVQQGGSRKNIMLNYNRIPTLRNVIFFLIDPYLQV